MRISRIGNALAACCLAAFVASSRADTIKYTFAYNGTGTYTSETAKGSGSFSVNYTPGSTTGTLTAFSFTDTLSASNLGSSIFTYSGLSDISSSTISLTSGSTPVIANLAINTDYVSGTNYGFGPVKLTFFDSGGTVSGSTAGNNSSASDFLADFTSGSGTVTPAFTTNSTTPTAVTAEPTTISLLLLGIFAIIPLVRRRSSKRPEVA